jgi:hypothetical protein
MIPFRPLFRILLCLVAFGPGLLAQPLQGVIKDAKSGERLPNAIIVIKGTGFGTKSNVEGFFVFPSIPDTPFAVQARFVGYVPEEIRVDPRSIPPSLTIALTPQDIPLGEVTVVAEKTSLLQAQEEPSLTTVSPRMSYTLPSIGQPDIFRSLQLLPGVVATNDRESGLYIRGGTPDQNLVLLDGMTVYQVDHFFGFFSAFNPDAIKDVQLYKGGYPAVYGGRLSSVVDLTGKSGDPDGYHVNAGLNLLSGNALVELPVFQKGSFLVAARRSFADIITSGAYTSLYNFLTNSSGASSPQPVFGGGGRFGGVSTQQTPVATFYDIDAKLTYNFTPADIVSASFYAGRDDLNKSQQASTNAVQNTGFQFTTPATTDETQQDNIGASLKWFHQWGPALFSNLLVSATRYSSAYNYMMSRATPAGGAQSQGSTDENNDTYDRTVRLDNQWILSNEHEIDLGGQVSGSKADYALNSSTAFNEAISRVLTIDQHATQSAVYLQDKWRPLSPFEITAGVRGTAYSLTGQFFAEPRFSTRFEVTSGFSLKGAVGLYHQFVNEIVNEDLTQGVRNFWILSDKTLIPGSADHYILGTTLENDEYLLDIEGYYKRLDHLVEFSQRLLRTPTDPYTFYDGSGRTRGVEVLLQKKHGALQGWLSYTLGKAEVTFPGMNGGATFPADQDQTHELKLVGTLDLGANWNVAATFVYATGRPYTSPVSQYAITLLDSSQSVYTHISGMNAYRLPSYQRLDLTVSKRFGDERSSNWIVGLSAFNMYNHTNIDYYQYDLSTTPIHITQVTELGFTPTVFVQVEFK